MLFTGIEMQERINKLQAFLKSKNVPLAVFNQPAELFYYTGSFQPLYLLVPAEGEPLLLARKAFERIKEDTGLKAEGFANSKELTHILDRFALKSGASIGFVLDSTSWSSVERFRQLLPETGVFDLSMYLRFLRMVKSPAEIQMIKTSGKSLAKFPDVLKKAFKPGITELELSTAIEKSFRLDGCGSILSRQEGLIMSYGVCTGGINSLKGNKFDGVCAGAGLSAALPFGASRDVIRKGEPVLMDYCFIHEGYHADMTRMASWGKPSADAMNAYKAMLQIEKAVLPLLKPGIAWKEPYELSAKLAEEKGYGDIYMGTGQEKVRFLGHGVGVLLDEPPFLAPKMEMMFEAGMTVAIEPKVAVPGLGVIGIENTYLITEKGTELLTTAPFEWLVLSK